VGIPERLIPPTPESALAQRHRRALAREKIAWERLAESHSSSGADERSDRFKEWLSANQALRETQSALTADAVRRATDSMRDCAEAISGGSSAIPSSLSAPATRSRLGAEAVAADPKPGAFFHGRGKAIWEVLTVSRDALEPAFFLVHLECRDEGTSPSVHEVYSEDWTLFCVIHGLQPIARPASAG
jgi:hypothetical protein